MMKKILFVLIGFLSIVVYATEQEDDILIIGKDTIYLQYFPLEVLKLQEKPFDYTTKTAPTTACWRGYKAVWRIVNEKLLLERILRCSSDKKVGEENIFELFESNEIPYKKIDGGIFAEWLTIKLYDLPIKNYSEHLVLYDESFFYKKIKEKKLKLVIEKGLVAINVIGNEEPKIIGEYKDVERLGNFITRWYFDLVGTSLVWKQKLILYSDSTYHYTYQAGECATTDEDSKGIWKIKNDTLQLVANNDFYNRTYVISNGKLYFPEIDIEKDPKNWEMK